MNKFLSLLKNKIIVFDGAMGTSIQDKNLNPDDFWGKNGCNEILVFSKPCIIQDIHSSFLEVGCDVIETDTKVYLEKNIKGFALVQVTPPGLL
ncbi:hypothetical protein ES703_105229 [subsurface metagenome]